MSERNQPPPGLEEGDIPDRLAADEFYRAIAVQPRRRALAYLVTNDQCTVDELVDVLCGWETVDTQMVPAERATQLRIELAHVHLPVLSDAGLVDYEWDEGVVEIEDLEAPVKAFIEQSIQAETD